jgi:hypothetical protein
MPRLAGSAARWALVWAAFAGLWLLLAGTLSLEEVVAAAAGASVATTATALVARQRVVQLAPRLGWVVRAWRLPGRMVLEFGLLLVALRRRLAGRPLGGTFRAVPFPGGRGRRAAARRALAAAAGSLAANAYVVGFDEDAGLMLVHELVPGPPSETLKVVRPS